MDKIINSLKEFKKPNHEEIDVLIKKIYIKYKIDNICVNIYIFFIILFLFIAIVFNSQIYKFIKLSKKRCQNILNKNCIPK
ncbi:hypothetical protein IOLA_096 [uncultured bacterium]|nr:hypothetical protein IOLA_096 [uncultured bacterium]